MANLLAKALDGEEGTHLGTVRPSMIQNELLLKAPMGTARRRGHPLPQGKKSLNLYIDIGRMTINLSL